MIMKLGGEVRLGAVPLDDWHRDSKGSSARILAARPKETYYALKIAKPGRLFYAAPLFLNEVRILQAIEDIPGVTPMVDCGFIHFNPNEEISKIPTPNQWTVVPQNLKGGMESFLLLQSSAGISAYLEALGNYVQAVSTFFFEKFPQHKQEIPGDRDPIIAVPDNDIFFKPGYLQQLWKKLDFRLPYIMLSMREKHQPNDGQSYLDFHRIVLDDHAEDINLVYKSLREFTAGELAPVQDCLEWSVQILQILERAHQRGACFIDHKLVHYYWCRPESKGQAPRIACIDWNFGFFEKDGLADYQRSHDLAKFAAQCFFAMATGRYNPSMKELGAEAQATDASKALSEHKSYRLPFDDIEKKRLDAFDPRLREIMTGAANNVYSCAANLIEELEKLRSA